MPSSEEAAATLAATLLAGDEEETEDAPSSEGTETTETVEQVEMPDFDIELPADLTAELEGFDEEDIPDDEEEMAALAEQYGEDNPDLLKRLRNAEKKAQHFEQLRVQESRKNWQEEATKFFPLAEPFLSEIQQTSRRGYLRTAKQIHDRMRPIVEEKVLKPARDAIEQAKTDATTEAKKEAREAWGQPVKDDGSVSSEVRVTQDTAQARRKRGELSDVIRNMLFPKENA